MAETSRKQRPPVFDSWRSRPRPNRPQGQFLRLGLDTAGKLSDDGEGARQFLSYEIADPECPASDPERLDPANGKFGNFSTMVFKYLAGENRLHLEPGPSIQRSAG